MWRTRGVLGVALAAALVAETFVATGEALAAPPVAPAQEEPTRGPNGLEAPDIASARTIAQLEGERVEVIGERTESSSTWAMPDGTMTTGQAAGPIWIRQGGDGTSSADWAAVDLTLELDEDGNVAPKAHPAGLVLAGEGVPADGALVSMQGPSGETVGLEWTDELPVPTLEGPRAVYADVQPGVDLVVEATRTGYEQFFVLTERPGAGEVPELALTVVGEGLQAVPAADGGVEFTTPAGEVLGASGTPLVWDAAVDAERLHPITEPWAGEGEQAGVALPPVPDWSEDPAAPAGPTVSGPAAEPESGDPAPAEDAGRVPSPEAAEAGGSAALPLPEAVTVTGPGEVELALTPDAAYLAHPDTEYPVVVDPEAHWLWGFDTWVQTGYSSDQSGSTELRLGTFDGGASVARSFITFDFTEIRYRQILDARLSLWAWHSGSCAASAWEVWHTGLAGTGTRINAEPVWHGRGATSTETKGYSTACNDGWISANVTGLMQLFSDNGIGAVGVGLRASNETDNAAWKKFNSADAGAYVPAIYVRWNTRPQTATGLTVSHTEGAGLSTSTTQPRLSATVHDADGTANMLFHLYSATGTKLWETTLLNVPNGSSPSVTVPAGKLVNGQQFSFMVHTYDGYLTNTTNANSPVYSVDTTAPRAPSVSSTDYPSDGDWHKDAGQAGSFAVALAETDPTVASIEWGLDKTPDTKVAASTAALTVTPTTNGRHVLQVRTVDKAGNRSPIVNYVFYVGRGGLTSPLEGAQVVRRVRLTMEGEAGLTHVKFTYRRPPDQASPTNVGGGQDIDLATLTRADGTPLTDTWTPIADLGDYATWDAGSTLGVFGGPVQVQAVMAENAQGGGAYPGPWVTVTVSPDAKNAATDSIGPGSVNLLTGDYTLSSTDVEEFGLSLGRAASSRDPNAGLQPQAERLTATQQSGSAETGFATNWVDATRSTAHWRTGPDALRVVTKSGGNGDSFVDVAVSKPLQPGGTYRFTGWIYVPAATGLSIDTPNSSRGLRLVGIYPKAGGGAGSARSDAPTLTDTWQQLSLDFTVPATATGAGFVRLYNGFTAGGKEVFFDDLSLREIWSPLGPQWSLGTADEMTGTAYSHISQPYPDVAAVHLSGGGEIWFTSGGNSIWWPEPGAESMTLTQTGDGTWKLTELDGTVSEFARQPGASNSQLVTTSPPAATGTTRLVYEKVDDRVRLTRMIAPVEPGIDPNAAEGTACTQNPASTPLPAGCEVLQLVYATTTTATGTSAEQLGSFAQRLSEVKLWSAASPSATAADAVVAVRYGYDTDGRLREVWDPRIPDPLKTRYTYDADGRVVTLTPPGELPWQFGYGTGGHEASVGDGDVLDRSSGRLLRVSRASLVPGTLTETGPATTSTVVYAVPLTRAAGGPHDLDPAALATWAQRSAPTDATAIFGPEDVPTVTTASATTPGADGYRPALIHYLDSSGREVNTATPAGPDAPGAGYLDTAEYDSYGNVTRSLSAGNRLLALGQGPTAAADLAALNLTAADTATRAVALSSTSTYGPEGLDLLRSRGPLLRLAVGNDPANVQLVHDVTTYTYDEGKPDGFAYHLVTTQTDALLLAGSAPEQLVDVTVTRNGYDPIDAASPTGATSGWKVGSPTTVTADAVPGGANLTAGVRYDAQGRAVESRRMGAADADAGRARAAYYTAGAHPERAECGNKPAWAGLPCANWVEGAVTGHDPARMAAALPVRTVTGYNRYGSVTEVTETATGPVAGAPVTQTRTTTTVYDAADRVVSSLITATGAGTTTAPMPRTVNTYDPTTGHVTVVSAVDPASNAVLSTVEKTFDALGRMTRYADASGGWTASVFDAYGKPVQVTDSLGSTTTFTYDRAVEPRGFLTSVTDSVAGTISASYGPDGELLEQLLPGGVELRVGYDANRSPISRTYTRTGDGVVIASSAVVENAAGEWVTHTTAASAKRYSYDGLHHLTEVQDTVAGACTTRQYGYTNRARRASLQTAVSGTATCADPDNPGTASVSTVGYAYDSADRLVSDTAAGAGDWVYDPLGRITGAPVRGSPGATVANAYYANDLVASQTIPGLARQTWNLDPLGRFASYTSEAWAAGGDGVAGWQEAVTKVNHYDSDSDNPAWIAEDASLPDEVTRYVDGLDGNLAVQTGKTGARVLQLIDLHGDVMTTLPIRDGETTADWTALAHQAADEFGNPTDLTTGAPVVTDGSAPGAEGRYGWLGGKQRSADALAGVLLMGVRMYDPATGRFWSPDPVPGGNATAYDYCAGDPVNCTDLDGQWGWFKNIVKKVAKTVAKVAEVVATVVPGPIGAAAAAVSAGAYAVTGNKAKALEMGVTAIAAMIPGGGAIARAGFAAARAAGRVAAKVGGSVVREVKAVAGRVSSNLAVRLAGRIYNMSAAKAEKVAGLLGSKKDGARNFVGRWFGREVMNPRNSSYFGRGSGFNTGPGNRIGHSSARGSGGRVMRPAIRIAVSGKRAGRQPHYYLD